MKALALPRPAKPAIAALPLLVVLVWSVGYLVAKNALVYTGPLTLLFISSATAAIALLAVARFTQARWPTRARDWLHLAVVGCLAQALQFIGLYGGLKTGMSPGVAGLIIGLAPIALALAGAFFDEPVVKKHWLGTWLGLAGAAIVIASTADGSWLGYQALGFALIGITAGALYQKRFCTAIDAGTGGFVQLATAAAIALPLAIVYEGLQVTLTPTLALSAVWLALVNALVAMTLLHVMSARMNGSAGGNLIYLVPGVTAVLAVLALGESLSPTAVIGFALAGFAVYLCTRN